MKAPIAVLAFDRREFEAWRDEQTPDRSARARWVRDHRSARGPHPCEIVELLGFVHCAGSAEIRQVVIGSLIAEEGTPE